MHRGFTASKKYTVTASLAIWALAAQAARAESEAAAALTWRDVLQSGGLPMYVLAGLLGAMSILAVALVIYFFIVLRASQVAPYTVHRAILENIRLGAFDTARKACEHRPCPLSAVALTAMDYVRDVPDVDPALLKDIMEGEGARQSDSIMGQTQYLLDIAAVAPMIGLLGTVWGMIQAFGSIATDIASAKPIVLAEGVSQALLTTAWGLMLGIPAMIFYAYFRRQASKVVSYLESATTDIMTALQSRSA